MVTLSTENNAKPFEQLKYEFKQTFNQNKYQKDSFKKILANDNLSKDFDF